MSVFLSIGDSIKSLLQEAFGINLTDFLINIIATVLLFLVVRFFFWNKVTAFLDKKKAKIRDEYKDATSIREAANQEKAEAEATLSSSKKQANLIIDKANKEATIEANKIVDEARAKANTLQLEAREEAEKAKNDAVKAAKGEIVDVAYVIAKKMIDENIDQEKYNDKVLKEIEDQHE